METCFGTTSEQFVNSEVLNCTLIASKTMYLYDNDVSFHPIKIRELCQHRKRTKVSFPKRVTNSLKLMKCDANIIIISRSATLK